MVTTPLSAAPSAMVANSSSASGTDPVRRTRTPLSGVRPSLAIVARMALVASPPGLEIAVVEDRLDVDEAAQVGRLGRAAREQPAPRESRMLALLDLLKRVGNRGERGFDIFERRFFVAHALERLRDRAKDAAQRRIGGERAEKRLRLDQFVHVAPEVGDAEERERRRGRRIRRRPGG